ncbi:BnaC06g02180D [Brassica napus]|uniref:WAT1-related protein n=1 Tax=Brassica napus TaxID=3708 RepID=A0A078HS16_BRANA|nr:BnaC06g02180D [Brassica napus]
MGKAVVSEKMKLLVALITLQFCFAGFHIVSRVALNIGVSKVVYPVYRNILALLLIGPFAYFLEKKERPPLRFSLLVQFFLLALIGITANQGFYLLGLTYASPTFASAVQNSVPAITFIMACTLRIEHINLVRRHLWDYTPVLKKYPAKLTLTSFTCFFGLIQFLVIALFVETDPNNWIIGSWEELFTILYAGIVASGLVVYLQTWCIYKGGPVFVAVFQPLQTLLVAAMAFVVLGDQLYSGSIVGSVFIMLGLYLVLWGKTEEKRQLNEASSQEEDHESLTKNLLGDETKEAQDSESPV